MSRPPPETFLQVVLALREVGGQASAVDPCAAEADPAVVERVAGELQAMGEHTVELMLRIQRLEDAAGTASPAIGDICFAGVFELKRVVRELASARDPVERLVAAERARRKLRRAIRAVLDLAPAAVDSVLAAHASPSSTADGDHVADVQAALDVRRVYASFRRSLRRPLTDDADGIMVALRYAAGALAMVFAAPAYASVRTSDRAVLRSLRDRTLAWARTDRGVSSGLHLLEDLHTCGDLLRGINRRQEVRDHDHALLTTAAAGPDGDLSAWLAALAPLTGLDDALDVLLASPSGPPAHDRVAAVLDRLAHLL